MSDSSSRSRPWRSSWIIGGCIALFLFFIVFALVWATLSYDKVASSIIQVFIFLSSTYASWIISRHFATKQKAAESRKMGVLAGRRVIELYKNVQSLLSKTLVYRDPNSLSQERFIHIANRLEEISFSVRSTLADVKSIAEIGIDDEDELGIPADQEASGIVNVVACPYCHAKNYVSTPTHAGATQEMACIECKDIFITHRRPDRTVFARPRVRKKSTLAPPPKLRSVTDRDDIVPIRQEPPHSLEDPRITVAPMAHVKVKCPSCPAQNEYGYRSSYTYLNRSCFECFTRFRYDLSSTVADIIDKLEPVVLHAHFSGDLYSYIHCAGCAQRVRTDKPTVNSRNERIVQCFRCGTSHISEIPDIAV